jgi:hypothetical protein
MLYTLARVIHHGQRAARSDDDHCGQHDEYGFHWRPRFAGPPTIKSNRAADEPMLNKRRHGCGGFQLLSSHRARTKVSRLGRAEGGSVLPQ